MGKLGYNIDIFKYLSRQNISSFLHYALNPTEYRSVYHILKWLIWRREDSEVSFRKYLLSATLHILKHLFSDLYFKSFILSPLFSDLYFQTFILRPLF